MRIILYTGKGGVGKTSIAAITACGLARKGKKVIIISTDQAHSLSDSFEVKIGNETTQITNNLDAIQIDVVKESEMAWGNLQDYLKQMLTTKANGGIEVEELLVFPGLEELFSLFKILDIYEENRYDVLIVDCAPTGETLSLLKFPEKFGAFIDKTLPIKRKAARAVGPAVEKIIKMPMPKSEVFDDLERLMDKLDRLQCLMLDKETVSLRIVTTPEKIVLKEAKRNFTFLHLYDYNVDAVIVNKVYPKEALVGYFNKWATLQKEGISELRDSFADIPMFWLNLQQSEIKSLPVLENMSSLYGESNPEEVLFKETIFRIIQNEEMTAMEIHVPFADKEEMELRQEDGDISISIKNERRTFTLPDGLKGKAVVSAKMEDGKLLVKFES